MKQNEKDKHFFKLFELAPIPWQSLDSNGCFLEVNGAWLKTFGYHRQAILGKHFAAFLTTESREKFNNAFPFFKSTGIISSELILLHKNGQKRNVSINGTIEKNRDGSFKRTHCILKDTTESHQTLKKYEEHNRKFEVLSHSASEMLELKDLPSIYNYICSNIQKQYPGSIVLIISVDEAGKDTCLMDVEGVENRLLHKAASIAGFDPLGKKYKLLPGHQKIWRSGNLYEFKGGLAEFASTEFPAVAAKAIQKVLDIHKIYTIGINKEANLLSAVHVITRHREEITDNKFIESFVKQAGIVIQRKMLEEELHYHSMILNQINDVVTVTDLKGRITYINQAVEKIFEEPPASFLGQSLMKKFPEAGAKKMKQLLEDTPGKENVPADQKNRTKLIETKFSRWDDHPIHLSINVSILQNETGEASGLLGIIRDVTKQKRSESALKQSAEKWYKTFRSMHTGITLLDNNQQIIQSNRAFQEMLGKKEEELQGHPCFQNVHGTDNPVEECPFLKMKKTKQAETAEMNIGGRDYQVTVDPILNEQGQVTGAVHSMVEITQQKREKQIKKLIYETAKTSIISTKLENLLEFVRQELGKLIDTTNFYVALYTAETDKLRKIIFLNEGDDFVEWKASESLAGKVIQSGKTLLLNDEEAIRRASRNRTILGGIPAKCWLGVPLTVDRQPVGVMVLKSNSNPKAYTPEDAGLVEMIAYELSAFIGRKRMVKDLIKAKKEAEKSDKLKSAFLANMSHEIRTPMNGILGFIELLNEPHLEEKNKKQYIDILNKSSRRLLNTINDIIEISKIDVGEWDIDLSEVNIREILPYFVQFFTPQAIEKGITLEIKEQLPEDCALVSTDRSKLEGILTNLISNALKFTDKGSIELGNYVKERSLLFYVKDTGKGIPADKLDAIFERFTQAETELTRGHEGSGLGLSIVKANVEKLGGTIWVESEMGKGSTFFFTIPHEPVIKQEKSDHPNDPPPKGWENEAGPEEKEVSIEKKGTVLIAEDNPVSTLLLKTILTEQNFDVIETTSGEDAVRELRDNPGIDLILMDIKMPGMSGLEAAREIREFNSAIPIIAQTAHALENDKEKALEAGCNDYLSKPIRREELKKLMQKYL